MIFEQNSVEIVPVGLQGGTVPPVFCRESGVDWRGQRDRLREAARSWLASSPSEHTRIGYSGDLRQFFRFSPLAESSSGIGRS